MKDERKTKKQLVAELEQMRQRIADLEQSEEQLRQVETTLREDEHRLRAIIENTPGVVYSYDVHPDSRKSLVYIGPGLSELLGEDGSAEIYENEDRFLDMVHPQDQESLTNRGLPDASSDQPRDARYRIKLTSGEYKWIRSIACPHHSEDGNTRWYGVIVDITEQKLTEEELREYRGRLGEGVERRTSELKQAYELLEKEVAEHRRTVEVLRESEERFRRLYERAPLGYQSLDEDGRFIEVNQAWLDLLGYSREEVVGLWFGDLLAPQYVDRFRNNFPRFKETGEIRGIEFQMVRKDRSHVLVSFNGKIGHDEKGNFEQTHCILYDITDRREMEEKLHQSKQEWEDTFNAISDWVCLVDVDARILRSNSAGENYVKCPPNEIIGAKCCRLVHGSDDPIAGCPLQRAIETQQRETIEYQLSGSGRWIMVTADPVYSEDGTITGAVHIVRDITDHKLAEKTLRESEDKFRNLVDNTIDWVWQVDSEGTYAYVSPNVSEIMGYRGDEVIGKKPFDFMSPDEARRVGEIFREVAGRKEQIVALEDTLLHRDGHPVIFETNATPLMSDDGELMGYFGTCRDITERKEAEETLRASEQRYRYLFERNLAAVYRTTLDGRILDCNQSFARMLGYESPEEVKKYRAHDFYFDDTDREIFIEQLKTNCTLTNFESCLRKKDGRPVWLLKNVSLLVEVDGRIVVQGTAIDITERKRTEEALRESEEKYRLLVEHANEGIAVAQDGMFKLANPKMIEISGYSEEELIAMPFVEFLHPEEREMVLEHHVKRISGDAASSTYDLRVVTKDGTMKWLENNGVLITWQGRPATLNFLSDITERKLAEEKLHKYQHQLRSLASELSLAEERERRILAGQLHDGIGQALAVTKVKLGALKKSAEGTGLSAPIDEIHSILEETIQNTRTLTFDLSPPILYELGFESAVEWLTDQIQERHNIQTTCTDDMQPKPLNDDIRIVLFQAVRELLVNVVKHSRARSVSVSLSRENDTIRVHVRDDGVGHDTSKLDARNGSARGFGLFNIRERLDHLGGRLDLESEPGQGTKATLIAPLQLDHKG